MSDMVDADAAGHSMSRHALRLVLRVLRRQSNDAGTEVVRPMEINSEIRIAPICCRAVRSDSTSFLFVHFYAVDYCQHLTSLSSTLLTIRNEFSGFVVVDSQMPLNTTNSTVQ